MYRASKSPREHSVPESAELVYIMISTTQTPTVGDGAHAMAVTIILNVAAQWIDECHKKRR